MILTLCQEVNHNALEAFQRALSTLSFRSSFLRRTLSTLYLHHLPPSPPPIAAAANRKPCTAVIKTTAEMTYSCRSSFSTMASLSLPAPSESSLTLEADAFAEFDGVYTFHDEQLSHISCEEEQDDGQSLHTDQASVTRPASTVDKQRKRHIQFREWLKRIFERGQRDNQGRRCAKSGGEKYKQSPMANTRGIVVSRSSRGRILGKSALPPQFRFSCASAHNSPSHRPHIAPFRLNNQIACVV